MLKKKLILILFSLFLSFGPLSLCFAAGTSENTIKPWPQMFVYENDVFKADMVGGFLFLLTKSKIEGNSSGYIISFFSEIEINGDYHGDVYSFFSQIKINPKANLSGKISLLSSNAIVSNEYKNTQTIIKGMSIFDLFMKSRPVQNYISYSNVIPLFVFKIIAASLNIFSCIVLYFIKKSFMEQQSILLEKELNEVIKNGAAAFFILIVFTILFSLTVLLMPLALLFAFSSIIISLIGEVGLAIFIGSLISIICAMTMDKNEISKYIYSISKGNSFACMILGVIIIEAIKMIPYVGAVFRVVVLPLIAEGMVVTAIINGFYKKVFYQTPYLDNNVKKRITMDEKRNIILGSGK